MKQTLLFTKVAKNCPRDEESFNAQILIRAGFIDKVSAGIYTYLPLGLRVINKIIDIIRIEMDEIGGQEILMPALTPKDLWQKTERWDNFDVLFKILGQDNKDYALGATHEEVVTPLMKKSILSHRDLPFSVYQIQTKFRNEKRAKAGLIRGREFLMKDLYSFHSSQESLDSYYEEVIAAYRRIFVKLEISDITYLTYASGGAFSKYSHEFQTVNSNGEDLIYICKQCSVAVNKEIIADQSFCPICGSNDLTQREAIEVGNIFKLGTRFSDAFDLCYHNHENDNQKVIMGCYGMGPSRIMGTIVEIFHDDEGIIWPEAIAPFKVHLLSLGRNDKADLIYKILRHNKVEVLYDDRDVSPGNKFAESDLIGCPYRLIIGKNFIDEQSMELLDRKTKQSKTLSLTNILKILG
ncbi:MAG: aminoacyl--tRNA ligase-related protein [Patescibacteria group bacterium]|jgi:prolyl-tRNA synthetase